MSPLAWSLQALVHPVSFGVAMLVKWWAIWFIFGRDFSRTSWMCLTAVLAVWLASGWVVQSDALGPVAGHDHRGYYPGQYFDAMALWSSYAVVLITTLVLEASILRWWMKRLVRPDWRWRHYDRMGYAFAHLLTVIFAIMYSAWEASAFHVS
ncbi:MAG: hypothetical protein MK209_07520 [Planctomycetes bacterium]|nr:hypothetical protein [Planctomycetota bacterium]